MKNDVKKGVIEGRSVRFNGGAAAAGSAIPYWMRYHY